MSSSASGNERALREVIERARGQREQERVPEAVRERLLSRALEAAAGERLRAAPARPLEPVLAPPTRLAALAAAALCAGVLLFAGARTLSQRNAALAPEPSAAARAVQALLGADIEVAAEPLAPEDRALGVDLFPEAPFAAPGAWQVRRWDDLGTDPVVPAAHERVEGALCLPLEVGARVLAAWPWPDPGAPAPPPVALEPRREYRLSFAAWAEGGVLPEAVFVGVGHASLPFSAAAGARVPLTSAPQTFAVDFTPTHPDPSIGVAFLASNTRGVEAARVCLRDVRLVLAP